MISTPCQNICAMDTDTDQCFGCGRTRHEITVWATLSEEQRLSIMQELPERMKMLEDKLNQQISEPPMEPNK